MLSGRVNVAPETFTIIYLQLILINFDRLKEGDKQSTVCYTEFQPLMIVMGVRAFTKSSKWPHLMLQQVL